MNISQEYFMFVNIAIILIYVVFGIVAFKNGFLYQLISLIFNGLSLVAAWFLGPILAKLIPLVKMDNSNGLIDFSPYINSLIYMVIVFIALRIIYLIIKPAFKKVSDIPILGGINKIGGFLIGLINATIIVVLLSLLLNTKIISNGQEIKEKTILKYSDTITDYALKLSVEHLNIENFKNKIEDFDVDEYRQQFIEWLIEQGIINE